MASQNHAGPNPSGDDTAPSSSPRRDDNSSDDITHVGESGSRQQSVAKMSAKDRERQRSVHEEKVRSNVNATLSNPLAYYSPDELRTMGRDYAKKHYLGDSEDIRAFELGAWLAQDPLKYQRVSGLTPEEIEVLSKEEKNRWSQPRLMYVVIVLCSICAAVQGMGKSPDDVRGRS
jgi:hypothetical protein